MRHKLNKLAQSAGGVVVGYFAASGVVITGAVIVPAAVASGYGGETSAIGLGVVFVWFMLRIVFGEDDADEYLEQQREIARDRNSSRR